MNSLVLANVSSNICSLEGLIHSFFHLIKQFVQGKSVPAILRSVLFSYFRQGEQGRSPFGGKDF